MIHMNSAMYSRNPKIIDAWYDGYEDCIVSERNTLIKGYKESKSLEEFVKLVFNEFNICSEDIENLEKLK